MKPHVEYSDWTIAQLVDFIERTPSYIKRLYDQKRTSTDVFEEVLKKQRSMQVVMEAELRLMFADLKLLLRLNQRRMLLHERAHMKEITIIF